MFINYLASCILNYAENASEYDAVAIIVRSIESGDEIATVYDFDLVLNKYGDLLICFAI